MNPVPLDMNPVPLARTLTLRSSSFPFTFTLDLGPHLDTHTQPKPEIQSQLLVVINFQIPQISVPAASPPPSPPLSRSLPPSRTLTHFLQCICTQTRDHCENCCRCIIARKPTTHHSPLALTLKLNPALTGHNSNWHEWCADVNRNRNRLYRFGGVTNP